jgi:RimJ/RimL family protein N-acetyltransferase
MRYPFIQLGCNRITAITKAKNQPARAFLCRLGFHLEGVHPGVFLDDDAISYGLLRSDASRWLAEEEIGKKFAIGSCDTNCG